LPLEEIAQLELVCEPDIFLEILLGNLKNEVVSHQKFIRAEKLKKFAELTKKINTLKLDYNLNRDEINELEKKLNELNDAEMRAELSKYRYFDILNMEKITPRFLTLARLGGKIDSLSILKDDHNNDFASEQDRSDHIKKFYDKIYTNDTPGRNFSVNHIRDFLGPEVCEHHSILTDVERDDFDRVLTIQELDKAVQQLNEKSAGGRDGISTKFLKKYGYYIRLALHRHITACFEKKTLTQSFNSAVIKLIPKKGDITKLKNWRPISLLNCVFKIVSKAVDNRLKKLNEVILSRAQKGFTNKRYIQECIINIIDNIALSEGSATPAFVLALDMAKALDTVKHDFITRAYEFFGIGPYF
jgi:hypothetical protein